MQESQLNYWSFTASPRVSKIEQALRELEEDYWTVPNRKVRAGDRAIIWKAKGNSRQRGIVALAEVLSNPIPTINPHTHLWADPQDANEVIDRVRIRYFVPPMLPIWDDENCPRVVKELNVYRATGGTVFHVTFDQWKAIMELVGGWPTRNPQVEDAELAIAEFAGKNRSGQGFSTNAYARKAIEQYAMQKAKTYYEEQGWKVSDVSATHSYDLLYKRDTGDELHVEVKGTTSDSSQILLTANEVRHAQNFYPQVALFVLSNTQIDQATVRILKAVKVEY